MTVVEGHASEELAAMDRDLRLVKKCCGYYQETYFSLKKNYALLSEFATNKAIPGKRGEGATSKN